MSCQFRRGLTLVEMLVVVAILAILLGILLPALTEARSQADRNGCMNNLYQIGAALDRFSEAHEGRLPVARSLAPPILDRSDNPPLMMKLIGQFRAGVGANIFHCPGDKMFLYPVCGISYFYNSAVSGRSVASLADGISRWPSRSEVPLIWDADHNVYPSIQGTIEVPRFHEFRVSLFGDWHVDRLADEQTPMF